MVLSWTCCKAATSSVVSGLFSSTSCTASTSAPAARRNFVTICVQLQAAAAAAASLKHHHRAAEVRVTNRFSSLRSSTSSAFEGRRNLSSSHFSACWPVYQKTLNKMERRTPNKDSVGSLSSCGSGNSGSNGAKTCKTPFMIGVAGGTASGKTTVCEKIMEAVNNQGSSGASSSGASSSDEGPGGSNGGAGGVGGVGTRGEKNIVAISEDSFYRELDEKESLQAQRGMFNFDHPDAFDIDTMMKCLADIRDGKVTKVPEYDFKTNSRMRDSDGKEMFRLVYPSDVVLLEGILVFYHKPVRELFDMKLFVDTDADTRLSRRVLRDIEHRGRDLEHVLHQYTTLVKPAFEEFCLPTKKFADVIIPRGADNTVAISLIGEHIRGMVRGKVRTQRRTSTFVDEFTPPPAPPLCGSNYGRPHLPHRTMMTQSISLPAGSPALRVSQHERTPPRFLITQSFSRREDMDPFQQAMAKNWPKDPNYQMRPH